MKKILLRLLIIYLSINVLSAAIFFALGGAQMLPLSSLPKKSQTPSLITDLDFFQRVVIENESHTSPAQRKKFNDIISQNASVKSVDDLSLVGFQALSVFDNAHTTLLKPKMRRLPLRFHWTSNALVVVKTTPNFSHLLGQRVIDIGGKSPEAMLSHIPKVVGGGTNAWKRYRSEYFYSAPSALALFSANVNNYSVDITFESASGEHITYNMMASQETMPGDPFWDFLDFFPNNDSFDTEGWATLFNNDSPLPLYLQNTEQLHFISSLPSNEALYIRMNGSFDGKEISIEDLISSAQVHTQNTNNNNIIVDFRFNRGGDYTKALPFVKALSSMVSAKGKLYLIVGPNTFSAGIIAASQFKRYIPEKLVVVGSEMGDTLRFKAEGFYPTLPHSGITLYLTKGWTDLIDGCGWLDDCWLPNKFLLEEVGTFDIDIPVENDWASFVNRQDRVLDTIEDRIISAQ